MKRLAIRSMLLCLLPLLTAVPVWAHKVTVFAYVEGDKVFTESYFPDGKKVEGGTVQVLDAKGVPLVQGTTDSQGQFVFPLPKKGNLTIVLDAGMGHKNSYLLSESEM